MEPPIACTLSATDLGDRLDAMAALGRDALIASEQEGPRAALRFAPRPGVAARLSALADAERACCPFLDLRVTATPTSVELAIDAPPDGADAVAGIVAAFTRPRP